MKPYITVRVETFIAEKMHGRRVLGVHFRGTDKKVEAERVRWEQVSEIVQRYLEHNPSYNCLFVASDEARFITFMERTFASLPVVSHDDRFRSTTGEPFHTDDHGASNYLKAEEALINCLLLARCETLIRTTSFLSAWASIFNPELNIILLNRPFQQYLWFPERLLIPKSMDNYLSSSAVFSAGA